MSSKLFHRCMFRIFKHNNNCQITTGSHYDNLKTFFPRSPYWVQPTARISTKSNALLLSNNFTDGSSSFGVEGNDLVEGEESYFARTHVPVMVNQVLDIIKPQKGQVIVDMTFGGGGHTRALLGCEPHLTVYALDRDPDAHVQAQTLAQSMPNIVPLLGRFSEIHSLLAEHGIGENDVDAVLFDVGSSSLQFDRSERGFALSKDGPLDMRMDKDRTGDQPTAADVVNYMDETGLYQILKVYGEEKKARFIAQALVESRQAFGHIVTTRQLAAVIESVFNEGAHRRDKLMRHSHVATKTFQALRTFVNNELNELHNGLEIAYRLLKPRGCCVAIAFHSLEDRIIKRVFHGINIDDKLNKTLRDHQRDRRVMYTDDDITHLLRKKWEPVSRKAALPTEDEIQRNPRSRSAKLRAAVKKLDSSVT